MELLNEIVNKELNVGLVHKFMNEELSNPRNLDLRIDDYNAIKQHLKIYDIQTCLEKTSHNVQKYKIHDIELIKNITKNAADGTIFSTYIEIKNKQYPIVVKIVKQNDDTDLELKLNLRCTKQLLKKTTRHFIFIYKNFLCETPSENVPIKLKSYSYRLFLNEKMQSDLMSLIANPLFLINQNLVMNIIIQIVFAIIQFHCLGYTHNDCHWGNFMYYIEEYKSGYFQYKINNEIYYLKNCGYTIVLHDFGRAVSHNMFKNIDNIINDFLNILSIFLNNNKNINDYDNVNFSIEKYNRDEIINISILLPHDNISNFIFKLLNVLQKKENVQDIIPLFLNYFIEMNLYHINVDNDIFFKDKTIKKGNLLNDIPFVISYDLYAI